MIDTGLSFFSGPAFLILFLILMCLPGSRWQRVRGAILLLVPVISGLLVWAEAPGTWCALECC